MPEHNDPKFYIIYNECSSDLKEAIKNEEIDFQLDPPHIQRGNAAEWAITTYKNNFISGLLTTNPYFPMIEWDRLLSQWAITLNLLRNYRLNPSLSAYAYLFGAYDFNKFPMALTGTRVIVHDKMATVNPGSIMAHRVGILVRHLTTTNVCSVISPLLA